jgi:hypothetical protein
MDIITAGTIAYVGKQLLGKTFDVISSDIAGLYTSGRNKIIQKATEKIKNKDDGKSANLRVARDVFWNGSFTDEAICAEYFGGILASSRSDDGRDDSGIYYVDLMKSLSSKQLTLHYIFYFLLNKILVSKPEKNEMSIGDESKLQTEKLFLSINELKTILNSDLGRDLHALHAKGLIGYLKTDNLTLKNKRLVPYLEITPKSIGVQLYAVAHNKMEDWAKFNTLDFGKFDDINVPNFYGNNIEELLKKAGIKDEEPEEVLEEKN